MLKGGAVVKTRVLMFVLLAAASSMPSSVALASPSCSTWNWQSEGVYWQTCVNDDGSQHCYQATDDSGSNAKEVSCR
jgi:hypothetical protein